MESMCLCGLFNDVVTSSGYRPRASNDRMINELERVWKRPWPILRQACYPSICLERLMKTTKYFIQDSRDLNLEPPENEAGHDGEWRPCISYQSYSKGFE
jgi:hypothetical protein